MSGYTYLYAVTMNDEQFKNGFEQLNADSLQVTDFKETKIDGTINASEDGVIYTSINYDTGWSVYIDGEKVSDEDIVVIGDALLGVNVTKGAHTVSFRYTPDGLILGVAVSVMALITLLLLLYIKKKEMFKFEPELYVETVTEEVEEIAEITETTEIVNISVKEESDETSGE